MILAGLAGGALAGLVVGALTHPEQRARATVVVAPALRTAGPGLATTTATIAGLVGSSAVLDNVTDALGQARGSLAGRVRARPRAGTALIDFTVDEPAAVDAERTAQQILVVLPALAASRLPASNGAPILVADTPGGSARPLGKPYVRDGLLGALAGSLAATGVLAGLAALAGRTATRQAPCPARAPPPPPPPTPAPKTSPPEQPAPAPESSPEPALPAEPEPEPKPAPRPAPAAKPQPATPPAAAGRARLADLERAAAAERDPAGREELEFYLDQLRGHVTADGTLPANFEPLVEQVFGTLPPAPGQQNQPA